MVIAHYDRVRIGWVEHDSARPGFPLKISLLTWAHQEAAGRMAVFDVDDPAYQIWLKAHNRYGYNLIGINTVFISKASSISRDIVRNTYSITRDPDKADAIVIPDPFLKSFPFPYQMAVAVVYADRRELWLLRTGCSFNSSNCPIPLTPETMLALVERTAKDDVGGPIKITVLDSIDFTKLVNFTHSIPMKDAKFIIDCKEYEDILMHPESRKKYIFDYALPYNPMGTLSAETLWLWYQNPDDKLVQRLIAQSDWQKYPFTVTMFSLHKFGRECLYPSLVASPFKIVVDTLQPREFERCLMQGSWNKVPMVEPEDFNLWQDYMLKILGIEGNNGYTDRKKRIPSIFEYFLKTKTAVAKTSLTKRIGIDALIRK